MIARRLRPVRAVRVLLPAHPVHASTCSAPQAGHGTRKRRRSLSAKAASIRLVPRTVGFETSTILRFQKVTVRFFARFTGSPSAPALGG